MKQKSTALAAALAMTLFAVSTRPACAQVLYGSAVGSVLDQTGAVVSGADVSFTNRIRVQQGQRRRMGRGCTGFNLDAGTYDLTVSRAGFRKFIKTGIPVTINSGSCRREPASRSTGRGDHSRGDTIRC